LSLTLYRLQLCNILPNATSHFAIGDVAAWSGIKRVGNAFIMGQFAATNIMKMMLSNCSAYNEESDHCKKLAECPTMDPMMALSIGKNALVYQSGHGVQHSEALKESVVGRGLGIDGEMHFPMNMS
jgi:NADH dehydrogenase FAD-containing subunit